MHFLKCYDKVILLRARKRQGHSDDVTRSPAVNITRVYNPCTTRANTLSRPGERSAAAQGLATRSTRVSPAPREDGEGAAHIVKMTCQNMNIQQPPPLPGRCNCCLCLRGPRLNSPQNGNKIDFIHDFSFLYKPLNTHLFFPSNLKEKNLPPIFRPHLPLPRLRLICTGLFAPVISPLSLPLPIPLSLSPSFRLAPLFPSLPCRLSSSFTFPPCHCLVLSLSSRQSPL